MKFLINHRFLDNKIFLCIVPILSYVSKELVTFYKKEKVRKRRGEILMIKDKVGRWKAEKKERCHPELLQR